MSAQSRVRDGTTALHMLVVSSSHSPTHVQDAMLAWVAAFRARLAAMDDPVAPGGGSGGGGGGGGAPARTPFARHRASLVTCKLQRDASLGEETDRHWEEVHSRRRAFARLALEAAALRSAGCDLPRLVELWDAMTAPGRRRSLMVRVEGRGAAAAGGGAGGGGAS